MARQNGLDQRCAGARQANDEQRTIRAVARYGARWGVGEEVADKVCPLVIITSLDGCESEIGRAEAAECKLAVALLFEKTCQREVKSREVFRILRSSLGGQGRSGGSGDPLE